MSEFDDNKDESFKYNNTWYEYDSVWGKRFYYLEPAATSMPDGMMARRRMSRRNYMKIRREAGV